MGRLRYGFVRRLDDSSRGLERELVERLTSTIESLRGGARHAREEREQRADHARRVSWDARAIRADLDELDRWLQAVGSGSTAEESAG